MSYGPQGEPVKVAANPIPPAEQAAPAQPAYGYAPPVVTHPEHEVKATSIDDPEPAGPEPTTEERLADKERLAADNHLRAETLESEKRQAIALLTTWENRAAGVLIKSDYQRGQRDAVLACVADLRKVYGL